MFLLVCCVVKPQASKPQGQADASCSYLYLSAGKPRRKRRTRRVARSSKEAAPAPEEQPGQLSQRSATGPQDSARSSRELPSARAQPEQLSARTEPAAAPEEPSALEQPAAEAEPAQPSLLQPSLLEQDEPAAEPEQQQAEAEPEQPAEAAEPQLETEEPAYEHQPELEPQPEAEAEASPAPTQRKAYVPDETIDEVLDSMGVPGYDKFFEPAAPQPVRLRSCSSPGPPDLSASGSQSSCMCRRMRSSRRVLLSLSMRRRQKGSMRARQALSLLQTRQQLRSSPTAASPWSRYAGVSQHSTTPDAWLRTCCVSLCTCCVVELSES